MPQARLVTSTCQVDAPPMPPLLVFGAICRRVFVSSTNIFVSTWIPRKAPKLFGCRRTLAHHIPFPPFGSRTYVNRLQALFVSPRSPHQFLLRVLGSPGIPPHV